MLESYALSRCKRSLSFYQGPDGKLFHPVSKLAEGGNAKVRVFHDGQREIAVKSPLEPSADAILLAQNELKALKKIYPEHHFYLHIEGESCRLVMPKFPGATLLDMLNTYPTHQNEIIIAAAKELARVHQCGVVHEDPHCENFVLFYESGSFHARAVDLSEAIISDQGAAPAHLSRRDMVYFAQALRDEVAIDEQSSAVRDFLQASPDTISQAFAALIDNARPEFISLGR